MERIAREDNNVDYEDAWEEESEDDIEVEAQEMARRLQTQLQADIERAQAEVRAQAAAVTEQASRTVPDASPSLSSQHRLAGPSSTSSQTYEPAARELSAHGKTSGSRRERRSVAAILTMKAILASAEKNSLVRSTLAASLVPGKGSHNVLEVLDQCISCRRVSKDVARRLSEAVISLAKSEVLFASLRNSDASAIQLDKGKRRWDAVDGPGSYHESHQGPPAKRMAIDQPDLRYQVSEAVRVVTESLSPIASNPTPVIHPHLITSIHPQLHQIFLFAVTSAPRAGDRAAALQELAGLIQMLGVLSGIQIGSYSSASLPSHSADWTQPPGGSPPDIGTAVYPCMTCPKVFGRLFSLKAHQRVHLLVDRPFQCELCVASFARSHDLKRHARLHEPRAYRCGGCGKVFSRRDAIKRHQDNRRAGRAGRAESVCAYAEVEEVEVDKTEGEDAVRRAKMWDGIAASANVHGGTPVFTGQSMGPDDVPEEGEMHLGVVLEAQSIVLGLHALLHGYVTKVLGHTPVLQNPILPPVAQQSAADPSAASAHSSPHAARSTLASVIASADAHAEQGTLAPGSESAQSTVQTDTPTASSALLGVLSLSEEQTRLLEQAIAQAALAAQAQAEAEAALEDEDEDEDTDEDEDGVS